MTIALVVCRLMGGNFAVAKNLIKDQGYFPNLIGESQLTFAF